MQIEKRKLELFSFYLLFVALAVSPAFVLGAGNRNLLLIGVMGLSPVVVLFSARLNKDEIFLLLFMLLIVLFPWLFHPESLRWSTIMYTQMFCLSFMAYRRLLPMSKITPFQFEKILKYLIYAYAVVLLIQQVCVLTGLPIFNVSNYDPDNPWKLNSLAAEPSHTARIVGLLMYAYICIREIIGGRSYDFVHNLRWDRWVWLSFLWTMVTMGSGTAFLFLGLVLSKFLRLRNIKVLLIIVLLGMSMSLIFVINIFEVESMQRTLRVIEATLTFDIEEIIAADHSASTRIVPILVLGKMVTISTADGWIGHGVDYVGTIMYEYLPGTPEGFSGGGMLAVWMEYGFLSALLFVVFSLLSTFNRTCLVSGLFWFLLVFSYGVNNQIVWLCVVSLFSIKHFSNHKGSLVCE